MDIRQLRYFQAIAEEGQISKAAQRLHMAQPPLSQQLKLLENEVGAKLMERGARKITLTEAGRLLQDRTAQIFELISMTLAELHDLNSGSRGTLSIGTVASSGMTFLPEKILRFHRQYPVVQFQVWEGDTDRILELLQGGIIDLGIVRAVFDPERYHSYQLPSEPMVAASIDVSDAFSSVEFTVNQLAGQPLLLHRSNESAVTESCRRQGFEPRIVCRGDDVRSLLAWANTGIGLAIVPQSAVGLVSSPNLQYRVIGDPYLEIKKAVVWLKSRHLSIVAKKFLEIACFAGEC